MTDNFVENVVRIPYLDNVAILTRDPVYSFWGIHLEKGITPKEFEGMYTDLVNAKIVVQRLENVRKEKKAVRQ